MRAGTTVQYDAATVQRFVAPLRPLVQACIDQHPPRTLPASLGVTLELWSLGGDAGKVREVSMAEPAPLTACMRDAFMPLSFGPPKLADRPPGAVFIALVVEP